MKTSENIADLSAALAKAQGAIKGAVKDSANPFFKSRYADLSSVWDACRIPLSANGLSIVQASEFIPEAPEMVVIETQLNHSSGQWIQGRIVMKPVKNDPQSIGSCITYARRYSLAAMVGIAPEDDDGNAASGTTTATDTTKEQAIKDWIHNVTEASDECDLADFKDYWPANKEAVLFDTGQVGAAQVYKVFTDLYKMKKKDSEKVKA